MKEKAMMELIGLKDFVVENVANWAVANWMYVGAGLAIAAPLFISWYRRGLALIKLGQDHNMLQLEYKMLDSTSYEVTAHNRELHECEVAQLKYIIEVQELAHSFWGQQLVRAVAILRADRRRGDKNLGEARRLTESVVANMLPDRDRRELLLFRTIEQLAQEAGSNADSTTPATTRA